VAQKQQIDETIMQELLDTPKVKEEIKGMSPDALAWYMELLVSEGIYAQYVKERKE